MNLENSTHKELFNQFIKRNKEKIPFKELNNFFISLPPVSLQEMMGDWKGGFFITGGLIDVTLTDLVIWKWTGKRFKSENKVEALRHNFLGLKFNFPIIGNARIRLVHYQNNTSAAMIYNYLPIIDHFRKVDDHTLLGAMDYKGNLTLFFYLYK